MIDLGLPEENSLADATEAVIQVLRATTASLVVAHEEFARAEQVAHGFGLKSVFITDWFGNPEWPNMLCLKVCVRKWLFYRPARIPRHPASYLKNGIYFSGPVFRELRPVSARSECRSQLALPDVAAAILVLPGGAGFHSEQRAPVAGLILGAFRSLQRDPKRLLWVQGEPDHSFLRKKVGNWDEVVIMQPHADLTTTILAMTISC